MNRAPTSVFVPPIRRELQHGSGIKHKRKRKNKKKIIQQIKSVK